MKTTLPKRHPISEIKSICDYFRITHSNRREEILTLIHKLEEVENSYCSLCTFHSRSFIYVSPSFQQLTGYPMGNMAVNGYDFFMSITGKKSLPHIMRGQAQYINQINKVGFKYLKPNSVEFEASFIHHNDIEVPVSQLSVMLNYEPGGDINTFFAIWISVSQLSAKAIDQKKAMIWPMLKDLHRLIFSPGSELKEKKKRADFFVKLKTPAVDVPQLSSRERELLLLLAKGQALKEAANTMKISYTTAETHRKNLFKKFETKSAAALIKKASKVYWLE